MFTKEHGEELFTKELTVAHIIVPNRNGGKNTELNGFMKV